MNDNYFTVEEFAKELKVCPHTIRKAIKNKQIIALRPGVGIRSPFRIPRLELERMALKQMYGNENDTDQLR